MAGFELSPTDERTFRDARRLYTIDGPDVPSENLDPRRLQTVSAMLSELEHPEAQEMAGWVNIERMFHCPGDDEARSTMLDKACTSFGYAYDMYEDRGYGFRQARLRVTAGSLALYDCWAGKLPLDDEARQVALTGWREAAVALSESQGVKLTQQEQARTELMIVMTRLAIRGDTGRPMMQMAVPATFRQRMGHLPRGVEAKHGRYNWDASLVNFDTQSGSWNLKGGIRVDTVSERRELRPLHKDVLLLAPGDLLDIRKASTLPAIDKALNLLGEVTAPLGEEAPDNEQRKAVAGLSWQLEQRIQEHGFKDFAVGKDLADL